MYLIQLVFHVLCQYKEVKTKEITYIYFLCTKFSDNVDAVVHIDFIEKFIFLNNNFEQYDLAQMLETLALIPMSIFSLCAPSETQVPGENV